MAESLINIRRRINTIKSTEKITNAMKLTSSVKFQHWKRYLDDSSEYILKMEDDLKCALSYDYKNFALKTDPCKIVDADGKLYILFTSTLGLCGGYNYNIIKLANNLITDKDSVIFIGEKGYLNFKNKVNKSYEDYIDVMNHFTYSDAKHLRHRIIQLYRTSHFASVEIIYTHYKNSMTFQPEVKKILPFSLDGLKVKKDAEDREFDDKGSILFEPSLEDAITFLIPHYIDCQLYKLLLEAELSESASRRNAMETATDNANDIISDLMITYNKSRQAAITQEITEVVAGATGKKDEN